MFFLDNFISRLIRNPCWQAQHNRFFSQASLIHRMNSQVRVRQLGMKTPSSEMVVVVHG